MHAGLIRVLRSILRDVGIPGMAVVIEATGLRSAYESKPNDLVNLKIFTEGRHLVIDVVVMTVHRNTVMQRVASIPG